MNVIPTISFFLFELLFRRYKVNHLGVSSLAALSSNSFSKEKVALGKRRRNFFWSLIFKELFPMNIFKPFKLDKDVGNFMPPLSLGRSSKFSRQEISNSTKLISVPNCDGRCFIAGSYFVMERVVTFSGATKACSKLSNDSACIMEVKVIHTLAMNRWFFIFRSPDLPYNGCLRVV